MAMPLLLYIQIINIEWYSYITNKKYDINNKKIQTAQ